VRLTSLGVPNYLSVRERRLKEQHRNEWRGSGERDPSSLNQDDDPALSLLLQLEGLKSVGLHASP
jgi:hypothetical protein